MSLVIVPVKVIVICPPRLKCYNGLWLSVEFSFKSQVIYVDLVHKALQSEAISYEYIPIPL